MTHYDFKWRNKLVMFDSNEQGQKSCLHNFPLVKFLKEGSGWRVVPTKKPSVNWMQFWNTRCYLGINIECNHIRVLCKSTWRYPEHFLRHPFLFESRVWCGHLHVRSPKLSRGPHTLRIAFCLGRSASLLNLWNQPLRVSLNYQPWQHNNTCQDQRGSNCTVFVQEGLGVQK